MESDISFSNEEESTKVGNILLTSSPSDRHERAGDPSAAQTLARTTKSRERSGTALGALLWRLLNCQQEKR
jgi:hypothetical protein